MSFLYTFIMFSSSVDYLLLMKRFS